MTDDRNALPLAELIAAEAARWTDLEGDDWFQVSPEEEEIFRIRIDRLPMMVSAWGAYEAFLGLTSGARWDMQHQPSIDAAKHAHPVLAAQQFGEDGWWSFAEKFSALTGREAWQWYAKHEAWQGRNGIMTFKDGS